MNVNTSEVSKMANFERSWKAFCTPKHTVQNALCTTPHYQLLEFTSYIMCL